MFVLKRNTYSIQTVTLFLPFPPSLHGWFRWRLRNHRAVSTNIWRPWWWSWGFDSCEAQKKFMGGSARNSCCWSAPNMRTRRSHDSPFGRCAAFTRTGKIVFGFFACLTRINMNTHIQTDMMKKEIAISHFKDQCEVMVSEDNSKLKQGPRYSLASEPGTEVSVHRCNFDHRLGCPFTCRLLMSKQTFRLQVSSKFDRTMQPPCE